MWGLVPRHLQILIVVGLGVVSATVSAWLSAAVFGVARSEVFFISAASVAISYLIIPVAELLWRPIWRVAPALNRWLFPDLNGTWKGEAEPIGGDRRPVTVWIRQGLFDITVTLETDQLDSHSTRAVAELDRHAHKFRIWYAYEGRPPPDLSKINPRHEGAACLEIDPERERETLSGRYFTDRATAGRLTLRRVSTKIVGASDTDATTSSPTPSAAGG